MEVRQIRIGIVGCGRVAENHIKAINKNEYTVLAAVAGGRNAPSFALKYGVPLLEKEEIAGSDVIDVLLVLTPHHSHFPYAKQALLHGKHVLVEKPVSFNEDEILKLQEISDETGAICMPGHSYLYLPEIARICRSTQHNELGPLTYYQFSELYYMPPSLIGKYEGPEVDVLCHQLYMSIAIAGIPSAVHGFTNHFDIAVIETAGKQVIVNMKYKNGTLGQIAVSWAADDISSNPWTFFMKVVGKQGSMNFSRRSYSLYVDGGIEQPLYQEMFEQQLEYFVTQCIVKGKQPLSTLEDALWVCRLHNAIIQSSKDGKAIIL
jgi:predicted dehydrogenase